MFIVKMVFTQALSQPCGWMSCAPQWSQAETTNRPSSGGTRVKQLFLHQHHHQLGRLSLPVRHTGLYWPSILQSTWPSYTLNRDSLNVHKCTVAQSRWREMWISPNQTKRLRTVTLVHIRLHFERKCPIAVLCMKAGSVCALFSACFHLSCYIAF